MRNVKKNYEKLVRESKGLKNNKTVDAVEVPINPP